MAKESGQSPDQQRSLFKEDLPRQGSPQRRKRKKAKPEPPPEARDAREAHSASEATVPSAPPPTPVAASPARDTVISKVYRFLASAFVEAGRKLAVQSIYFILALFFLTTVLSFLTFVGIDGWMEKVPFWTWNKDEKTIILRAPVPNLPSRMETGSTPGRSKPPPDVPNAAPAQDDPAWKTWTTDVFPEPLKEAEN